MMILLGLGNPGRAYARSRHNVGFWCVERVGRQHGIPQDKRLRHVVLGQGHILEKDVVIARPRTYMNLSGVAARYLVDRFHISPQELLVVCDDMDLPLGKLRIRAEGSSGGHNGLNSIIAELGTHQFPRLRIGIGRPQEQGAISFVLGTFTHAEAEVMREATERAAEAVVWTLQHGVESAMNRYN
ncbi:MAG: aminoacyl-tRNA hydrolase [Chloroflexota bacterium]